MVPGGLFLLFTPAGRFVDISTLRYPLNDFAARLPSLDT